MSAKHCPQCGGTRIGYMTTVMVRAEVLSWDGDVVEHLADDEQLDDSEEACDPPYACLNTDCPWTGHEYDLADTTPTTEEVPT